MGEMIIDEKGTTTSRSPTLAPQEQQRVLPLCSSCTASMPTLNNLLDNERVQQSLFAFNEAMAEINWSIPQTAVEGTSESKPDAAFHQNQPRSQAAPCSLCAAKRAIPILTTLLMEVKAMKKDKTVSKADKRALKGEIKGQVWEVKRNFKKEWKEAKREARK